MTDIAERLRTARQKAGYDSVKEAAEALGVSYPTYAGHENGSRGIKNDALQLYAKRFKVPVSWLLTGQGPTPILDGTQSQGDLQPPPNATIGDPIEFPDRKIPVYGKAVGGVDGEFEWNGDVFGYVICPPSLSKVSDAYAVYVSGESMSPRYEEGELIYINPKRTPKRGDYVVAQIKVDEHSAPHAFVKRLMRQNTAELVLQQFNPPKEMTFEGNRVVSVHVVVLGGEG